MIFITFSYPTDQYRQHKQTVTNNANYWMTAQKNLSSQADSSSLVKKLCVIHGTLKFIAVVRQCSHILFHDTSF
jgi:hypothetical protein